VEPPSEPELPAPLLDPLLDPLPEELDVAIPLLDPVLDPDEPEAPELPLEAPLPVLDPELLVPPSGIDPTEPPVLELHAPKAKAVAPASGRKNEMRIQRSFLLVVRGDRSSPRMTN
jgi:hypothetical protein